MPSIPAVRIRAVNDRPMRLDRRFVIYWMVAARRTASNFGLQRACDHARQLRRPLLVFEPLRAGYAWASDRLHAFVLQGMQDNAAAFAAANVTYLPYVEPEPGAGRGLLAVLARRACPRDHRRTAGFLPAAHGLGGGQEAPRATRAGRWQRPVTAARDRSRVSDRVGFRRMLQRELPPYLAKLPAAKPLRRLPRVVRDAEPHERELRAWPMATPALLAATPTALAAAADRSRRRAGTAAWRCARRGSRPRSFILTSSRGTTRATATPTMTRKRPVAVPAFRSRLRARDRRPRVGAADWDPSWARGAKVTGSREGWWGLPRRREAFLDELITWRELGYGFCFHRADYDRCVFATRRGRATLDRART